MSPSPSTAGDARAQAVKHAERGARAALLAMAASEVLGALVHVEPAGN